MTKPRLETLQPEVVGRVQLKEKLVYARDFSLFANYCGGTHQTVEAAQKTTITSRPPSAVAACRASQSRGPGRALGDNRPERRHRRR